MKVFIREQVYLKVLHWVHTASFEVSGFGKVIIREDGDLEVVDAYLVKQEGASAHTDIDGTALAKLSFETRATEGELKWWWHSHVNMPVFWSATDEATIKELGGHGWVAATVFNKKEECRTAVCYKTAGKFGSGVQMDDNLSLMILKEPALPGVKEAIKLLRDVYGPKVPDVFMEFVPRPNAEVVASWDESFKAQVTEKKYDLLPLGTISPTDWRNQIQWRGDELLHIPGHNINVMRKKDYQPSGKFELHSLGLVGYGSEIEALALGIPVKKYMNIAGNPRHKRYKQMLDDLVIMEKSGKLETTEVAYNNAKRGNA